MLPALGYTVLALISTLVVWRGSGMLERSASRLAAWYELPPIVQGGVIAAVGSSFPELSSTVLATLVHGQFELGVSAIVGSAIFNILVIPGLSGISAGGMVLNRTIVYKDALFYITSVAVLLLAFSFAIIYNPVEEERWVGEMSRAIALIPVLVYGLYLFLQQQDTLEYESTQERPDVRPAREWMMLAAGMIIILIGVEGLVRAAIGFGDIFNTPSFLWGLIVIAAGTSLPDAIISIRAARKGESVISMSNVLGSNIFDLLIAVPAGVLVAGSTTIDFAAAAPMMAMLTLATIALFAMLRTKLTLSRRESVVLLVLYGVFVAWVLAETFGLTDVMPA